MFHIFISSFIAYLSSFPSLALDLYRYYYSYSLFLSLLLSFLSGYHHHYCYYSSYFSKFLFLSATWQGEKFLLLTLLVTNFNKLYKYLKEQNNMQYLRTSTFLLPSELICSFDYILAINRSYCGYIVIYFAWTRKNKGILCF